MLWHSYIRKPVLSANSAPHAHAFRKPLPKTLKPAPMRAVLTREPVAAGLLERFRFGAYANGPP